MRLRPSSCFKVCSISRGDHQPQTIRSIRLFSKISCRSVPLRSRLEIPPPFPVTKTCPEPHCSCPPTPGMPEGSPIDYEQALNGTMAAYTQQVLICTGQSDWTSRIENDGEGKSWGEFARGLRKLMGRGGRYADVWFAHSLYLLSFCLAI